MAIMTGIKKTTKICAGDKAAIRACDFKMKNSIEMGSTGSKEFDLIKFTDFAPRVFHNLRIMNGISPESYIKSLGIQNLSKMNKNYNTMSQQNSSGKSGSVFFYTNDKKYMVKSIPASEFNCFMKTLSNYYSYLINNPNTLIVKYFGVHSIDCY